MSASECKLCAICACVVFLALQPCGYCLGAGVKHVLTTWRGLLCCASARGHGLSSRMRNALHAYALQARVRLARARRLDRQKELQEKALDLR